MSLADASNGAEFAIAVDDFHANGTVSEAFVREVLCVWKAGKRWMVVIHIGLVLLGRGQQQSAHMYRNVPELEGRTLGHTNLAIRALQLEER